MLEIILSILLIIISLIANKLHKRAVKAEAKLRIVKIRIEWIAKNIKDEIQRRSKYPNVGKIGCLRRLQDLLDSEWSSPNKD